MSTYEIVTVDWNPEQTALWKRYVNFFCPEAKVRIIPAPPESFIPFNWSSNKLLCFLEPFSEPVRMAYLDTDILVTAPLSCVFDRMDEENADVSLSWMLKRRGKHSLQRMSNGKFRKIKDEMVWNRYSSGAIFLRNYSPRKFVEKWKEIMYLEEFKRAFLKFRAYQEIALSYVVNDLKLKVHGQPLELHGNLLGDKKDFGATELPVMLHYHSPELLKEHGFEWMLTWLASTNTTS